MITRTPITTHADTCISYRPHCLARMQTNRLVDPAMMGEIAFERDIATRQQTLRIGEGMDGFGPIALSQQVGAALNAEQGTILERPIDQAVAPGVSAAQQIAELAFAEDMIGQTRCRDLLRQGGHEIPATSNV